jgi:hypothetical protein
MNPPWSVGDFSAVPFNFAIALIASEGRLQACLNRHALPYGACTTKHENKARLTLDPIFELIIIPAVSGHNEA